MSGWTGRRVFLTGHTGFKGAWLALWLHRLGAEVTGFALPPPTERSLFERARVGELLTHVEGDIRDLTHEKERLQSWSASVPAPPALDEAAEQGKEMVAAERAAARGARQRRP